ncbi:hypothetical protein JCM33374_g2319 [Metschnikowia sp. JCM 33374]|nr:hypothetical protein JCM33374_g2319 [Metschnikowia sp. JCM 33374]
MRFLAILKARSLPTDEMSILGDSLNGIQVNGRNSQDSAMAADASEVQVSEEMSELECVLVSGEDEEDISFMIVA